MENGVAKDTCCPHTSLTHQEHAFAHKGEGPLEVVANTHY